MRGQGRSIGGPERNPRRQGPQFFSTEVMPPAERLSFLRYFTAEIVQGGLDMNRLDGADDFRVEVNAVMAGAVLLNRTTNKGLSNSRGRRELADGVDDVTLLLGLTGEGLIEHNGHRTRLRPNEVVIVDFARPVTSAWSDCEMMILQMPRSHLGSTELSMSTGISLGPGASVAPLLHAYALAAFNQAQDQGSLPELVDRHLAELAVTLCQSLSSHGPPTHPATREGVQAARVAAMRATMARSYRNPMVTMRQVAASIGLSERSGHLLFERVGLNFTEELHALRLDRAREQLRCSRQRVVDVAFAVGFSDVSHFHRHFRRRFGCTPAEMRAL